MGSCVFAGCGDQEQVKKNRSMLAEDSPAAVSTVTWEMK
jgi:hypothetical protein